MRILVVDDEPDMVSILRMLLRRTFKAEVEAAYGCSSAREKLRSGSYDVVTVDYQLPDGDGFELLREVKSMDRPPPVIMVTGEGDEKTAAEATRLGANGYVLKDERLTSVLPDVMEGALKDVELAETRWRLERQNLVLKAIRDVNQLIVREKDRDRLLTRACELLVENRGYYNAWVAVLDDSGTPEFYAEAGLGEAFAPMAEMLERWELTKCAGLALEEPGAHVIEDPTVECEDCPLAGAYGGRGSMTVRLESGGETYGWLAVSAPKQYITDPEEIDLLEELADDIAFALGSIETAEARDFAELRYMDVIEAIPLAFWLVDKEGNIVFANKAACQMSGYEREELLSMHMTDLVAQEEPGEATVRAERIMRTGSGQFETKHFRKDGTVIDLGISVAYLPSFGERFVAFGKDITERRNAEERLKRVNAELEAYAHSVSHDLKGPISAIKASADLLDDIAGSEDAELNELADALKRNASNSYDRVESLLALAVSGQEPVRVIECRIRDVVAETLEEYAERIEIGGVEVRVDEDLGTVVGDPLQIRQVFSNLISNALKHNDSAEPVVEVSFLGEEAGGFKRYLVSDNGSGIPSPAMDRIFNPFFSAGGTGETGVGLSVAAKLVRVYGGEIKAYNDNGAVFEFTLRDYEPD